MSDKIETKLVSMLDALQNGVAEVGGKIVKYTPDVVNAAEWVVRIDGAQELVFSIFGLLLGVFSAKFLFKHAKIWCDNNGNPIGYIGGIGAVVFSTASFFSIINMWTWIMIFEPKLYIAKQIIESVVGSK